MVARYHVGGAHHVVGHIGMQIEAHSNWSLLADGQASRFDQLCICVESCGRRHRAVERENEPVKGPG